MALSWPSERVARSRSALPRGSRTAPGRAKGLEENGAGPSGGGGGERGLFGSIRKNDSMHDDVIASLLHVLRVARGPGQG